MSENHLLSFYGSKEPEDGYAERQQHLHQTAAQFGNIRHQHPWDRERLKQTEFYQQHKVVLDSERGAGYWLWKPYLLLALMKEIPEGDFLCYHDVGRAFRRDPLIGYRFTRPIDPLVGWAIENDGMFPGVYVPMYGPSRKWIKRDCFVLMDCDEKRYWEQPQVQAGINVWRNTSRVREFIEEWLGYCKDPRILTDQENQCGQPNFPEFQDHRHDQAILTNLLRKNAVAVYGDPQQNTFKPREVEYITARVAADKLIAENRLAGKPDLIELAAEHSPQHHVRGTLPLLQMHMEHKRDQPLVILEISDRGHTDSLLWKAYLNNAEVHTLYPGAPAENERTSEEEGLIAHSVDPSHRPSLEIFSQRMKKAGVRFDFIIEFGSGLMHDQQLAVGVLFDLLKPGGVFFIEQLEKALRPGQGDLNASMSNSTMKLIKRINLAEYQINSHYFTLAEVRKLEKLVYTAGTDWVAGNRYGIAMIRRIDEENEA